MTTYLSDTAHVVAFVSDGRESRDELVERYAQVVHQLSGRQVPHE